jgi:cytochrome c556
MRFGALILALLPLAACSTSSLRPTPALHELEDRRLRGLMAEMNSLILSEKEMTDQQKDAKRREYSQKMAESAQALGATVDAILARSPKLGLSQTEQTTFQALSAQLRGQTQSLEKLAQGNFTDAMPKELDKIGVTCRACHQLFKHGG